MLGGFGGFGGYGYGGYGYHRGGGGGLVILALIALGYWLHDRYGIEAVVIIGVSAVIFGCWTFAVMSTAFLLKIVLLAGGAVLVFGFNLIGFITGLVVASSWHFWSRSKNSAGGVYKRAAKRQEIFFDGIFSLLGYIAKADGVVCAKEIDFASRLMMKMQLNAERKARAQELFRQGKDANFDIEKTLRQVRKECRGSIGMFMRILADAAAANGTIGEVEKRVLLFVGTRLGLSASEVEQIEAAVGSGEWYQSQSQSQDYDGGDESGRGGGQGGGGLLAAYKILGVASNASDGEVKRSYRRLMSRHHPDKLAAQGLPPEMMRAATERAQEISVAYERIKKARRV